MYSLRKLEKVAGSLALTEQPVPKAGPGEVVLRVAACGVCGSDLHAYNQDPGYEFIRTPVTLGHEFAGIIVEVGPGVSGWTTGQHVCVIAIQFCGTCLACRSGHEQLCQDRKIQGLHYDGGMAEFAKTEARYLVPLPDNLSLEEGALVEPLSVALHCVSDRCEIAPGDLVVVTGPGIIGLLCALVARLRGARVIVAGATVDTEVRLPVAEDLGFETIAVGEKSLAAQLPRRVDLLIEASGAASALAGAFDAVRRGGSITVVGMYSQPVSWFMSTPVREELTIRCSYASSYPNYLQAIELMVTGKIPINKVTKPYPLQEGLKAFADALAKKVFKPLLLPDGA